MLFEHKLRRFVEMPSITNFQRNATYTQSREKKCKKIRIHLMLLLSSIASFVLRETDEI